MQAFHILSHSFRQLFGNFRQAIAISWLPMLVQLTVTAVILWPMFRDGPALFRPNWPLIIIGLPLIAAMMIWMAVNWHRFVLLNEQPARIPHLPREALRDYTITSIWIFLRIFLIVVLLSLIAFLVLMAFVAAFGGDRGEPDLGRLRVVTFAIQFVTTVLTVALLMRFAVTLPAAAIGADRSFSTACARPAAPLARWFCWRRSFTLCRS